ncbi:MAG: hypothetical protein LW832_03665 [Parachlamydia sp.]|jgi:hypothetical protein|nr:hypothetical protein [Parachlamydia sp.]
MKQTSRLLSNLANEINNIDKTRSGVAKSYFLAKMALIMDINNKEHKKSLEYVEQDYINLNAQFYLPGDNRWLSGLQKIQPPAAAAA